jgi:hypothetical protein
LSLGAFFLLTLFLAVGGFFRLQAVTPYRMTGKRGKNDAADAAAICEAVQRPHMRLGVLPRVMDSVPLSLYNNTYK